MNHNPDAEYYPYTTHQDTGIWRSAELQKTDEKLNIEDIEAPDLRTESTYVNICKHSENGIVVKLS